MRRIVPGLIALLFALSLPATALGLTTNWNLNGEYTIVFSCTSGCTGDYPHSLDVNFTNLGNGQVTGTGHYDVNPAITWTLTGTVSGTSVSLHVDYDANAYYVDLTGSIDTADGSMSGTAGNASQAFIWETTAGGARLMPQSVGDCSPGSYAGFTYLWKDFVPAVGTGSDTPVVTTPFDLEPGFTYRIEASGSYFAGGISLYDIEADAEYSQDQYQRDNNLGWTDSVHNYGSYGEGLLELKVNDAFVEWGAYSDSHRYTREYSGLSGPMSFGFAIYDIYAQNNTGGLCVAIFADQVPSGEIVEPADGSAHLLGQDLALEAYYYDDNPGSAVFWAVRVDENTPCSNTGTNQYWGNVDGDHDAFSWTAVAGGMKFTSTAPTTGWPAGDYCFVFNPGAGDSVPAGEADVRLISRFALSNPPVADPNGPYLVAVNGSVAFDGSGSYDPDGDTLTYAWTADGGSLNDANLVNPTFTAGSAPGVYDVTLQVTDDPGLTSDVVHTSVVVYDPSAGFVTGGGWIDSPAGAYAADQTLTGKATFGFVSKYQKGATAPTGNTQFTFQTGNLNFHSSSYQWLVVNQAGMNAQFKGTGTINGAGDYDFMLWAADGSPDTFRIQITDGSGATVYDSGVALSIGGGSIIVHTEK